MLTYSAESRGKLEIGGAISLCVCKKPLLVVI